MLGWISNKVLPKTKRVLRFETPINRKTRPSTASNESSGGPSQKQRTVSSDKGENWLSDGEVDTKMLSAAWGKFESNGPV